LVAVGPGFERAMNALYPCTLGRSRAVIAGAPAHPLPPPEWPLSPNPEARRVVAVGRPTGQKGWDYLSSALARLVAERPELAAQIELVILGGLGEWDGPFSDYSRRVSEAMGDLAPIKIANLGIVPHAQVLAYMRAAHLLIHPATFEPLGLVLLEAMAAGCGIIAGDAEGPSDLLRPPWGRLVAFGEPAQRVENLYTALNDWLVLSPAQITEQGAAAEVAARAYTWPACAAGHWAALSGG
jgi:D-inositol-3-phosphate glycosyltransferase